MYMPSKIVIAMAKCCYKAEDFPLTLANNGVVVFWYTIVHGQLDSSYS